MKSRFETPYSHPRWWWENNFIPDCFDCTHFQGMVNSKARCTAFPDGIPGEIILSKEPKHRAPYPGDIGVRYEKYVEKSET